MVYANELMVWAPTLLFLIALLWGFIVGFIRGYRKSTILFFHMLIIGGLCLAGYAWLCSLPTLDTDIITYANSAMNSTGQSIQSVLKVNEDLTSLKEILMELILSNMSQEDLIYHIVNENGAYIMTMVEMAYRLVFFIVMLVVYMILTFVMYIVYLIFYPVRRKIRRHNKKFKKGLVNHPYRKRRFMGGVVGTVRNCITSIIGFSFLGALLFIVTGGTTLASREELNEEQIVDFGDESFNEIYDYYSLICDMGDTGVFKVLNNFKDPENVPYYFYICDLVLQGSINDPNLGVVDENFYFRDETGSYVRFCKDVMTLIVKYAGDDLPVIVDSITSVNNSTEMSNPSGEASGDSELLNVLLKIMSKPGFVEEFNTLIDNFEAKTYYVNICLSTLTSVVNHIDLLDVSPEVKGLINCMFGDAEGSIKVTDLATEEDVKNLFKAVVKLISESDFSEENSTSTTIKLVQKALPELKQLSIFNDENRKEQGNKFLGSVYEYCVNTFVEGVEVPEVPENINWIDEFEVLLDAVDPILTIYLNFSEDNNTETVDKLAYMFDENNPKALENEDAYDLMVENLSKSVLLDVIFKSSLVRSMLDELLIGITGNEESSLPINSLKFNNTLDENGNIVYGETYKFLNSFKVALKNDLLGLLSGSMSGNSAMRDVFEALNSEVDAENTLLEKVLDSELLHYFLSGIITNVTLTDSPVIVPEAVTLTIVEEEKEFKIIKKEEIINFANVMYQNLDIILPEDDSYLPIKQIITDVDFVSIIDKSLIFEYTFTTMLINKLAEIDDIFIPEGYETIDLWVSTRAEDLSVIAHGETYNFIHSVSQLIPKDIADDADFAQLASIIKITEVNVDEIINSVIMRATASQNVIESQLYVPGSVCDDEIINSAELKSFLVGCIELYGTEENGVKYVNIDNLNIFNICSKEYTKAEVETVITSEILALNFEVTITDKENITVPISIVDKVELVDGSKVIKVSDEEFHNLIGALFAIKDTINLDDIDTHELVLYESKLDEYLASVIFKATLSNEISEMREVVMSEDTYEMVDIYNCDYQKAIIVDSELTYLLEGLFILFGEEENGDVTLKLDKDLAIQGKIIPAEDLEAVSRSKILTASIFAL